MKKWYKKISQSFLRKDEVEDQDTTPAVEKEEIKDIEAISSVVEQEDTTKTQKNK